MFIHSLRMFGFCLLLIKLFTFSPFFAQHLFALSQEELVGGAKKEGKLVFYASGTAEQTKMFLDAFQVKYPFVTTEYFRTGKTALLSRILLENQAKKYSADAIQSSVIELNIMKKSGALGKYLAIEAREYAATHKDPDGFWTTIFISSNLLGYNTRQVAQGEVPKRYEDLLLPRWKGKIGLDSNKIEWFAMLMDLKGRSFVERLAEQRPQVRAGNQLLLNLLAAGEYPLAAAAYEYSVEVLKEKDAPVDWTGLEPVIVYPSGIAMMSQPPHPYAARLFLEFMLSKDGQEVVKRYGRIPVRKDVDSKYGRFLSRYKMLMTDIELGQRQSEIHKDFRRLFQ